MTDKNTTSRRGQRKAIDWREVGNRMETARNSLERGWTPGVEERDRILAARAKALAHDPEEGRAPEEYIEVVEFLLAYERYGIESLYVREVYPFTEFTPLPCTPRFVLGVINVRGQILSVIDIKKFFDLPEKGLGDLNKVIILQSDKMEFGILADVILGVRNIHPGQLQPFLPTLTDIREHYLKGITADRAVILDGAHLLNDRNIVVHENM